MIRNRYDSVLALLGIAFLFLLTGSITQCTNEDEAYRKYCLQVSAADTLKTEWHLSIYLDIHACLTCCEDMASWQMLEGKIPECGGHFSIWAPRSDSVDVAEVMRLEGIKTPVHVLDQETVEFLQKRKMVPPIKVLFNGECERIVVQQALQASEAREFDREIIDKICSPE
jgi:hypothetical protein